MAKHKPLTDVSGEVRELTAADMKRFRPAKDVLSSGLRAKPASRGPQKESTKERKAISYNTALANASGDKRLEILRQVGVGGSISQAAREIGVSYKAAWQALDTLSNLAGVTLVESAVGGSGGGGARLTAAGEQLLRVADALTHARDGVLAQHSTGRWIGEVGGGVGGPVGATSAVMYGSGLAALGLRTSMRNQLPCTVVALEGSGQLMRVQLELADGTLLVARVTRESMELLDLKTGLGVLALCKATAVAVTRAVSMKSKQGRNLLAGRVSRIVRDDGGDEVSARMDAGVQLVGFALAASGLRSGSRVVMTVDEAAVVIALAG